MINCVIFDLDGTVYLGEKPIAGVDRVIQSLRDREIRVLFYTNRAHQIPNQVSERLARTGIDAVPEAILTGGVVTARSLGSGATAYYLGDNPPEDDAEPALVEALRKAGRNLRVASNGVA